MSRIGNWGVRLWRLAAIIIAAFLLHLAAQKRATNERAATFDLSQAQRFFPTAERIVTVDTQKEIFRAVDAKGRDLGTLLSTSPSADFITGYIGANNVLVALDAKGALIGAELLGSADTRAHVADVENSESFWKQFIGWVPSKEPLREVDAVSGSTLTSLGAAEAVQYRLSGKRDSLRFPNQLTRAEIAQLFPGAIRFEELKARPGWHSVYGGSDAKGELLGFAVRTSPASDYIRGHAGPTEALVAVAPDSQKILGVRIRKSYDTEDYVESVREDAYYLKQLSSFSVDQWATNDLKASGLEGVSGATETSFAIAEGIRRRFATPPVAQVPAIGKVKTRDVLLLGIVIGSLVMHFSKLRTRRSIRIVWQGILIAVFGVWLADLLSIALLVGWSRNGVAWETAPALILLVAVALVVPWGFRKQIYCHELCPHGAAQEWLGKFRKLHLPLNGKWADRFRHLPGFLLIAAVMVAFLLPSFDLARIEPFDAWALRGVLATTTIIAVVGLVASLFVPMAYCRFGCPTGALLRFLRSAGDAQRFGWRDGAALALVAFGAVVTFLPHSSLPGDKVVGIHLSGTAFGTTWNVALRKPVPEMDRLRQRMENELERIENTLSHWRPGSATAAFNKARTTYPIEVPGELITLVGKALVLSEKSDGAFDITVGPLVNAWGFGPGSNPTKMPDDATITALREFCGWEKLVVNTNDSTLAKKHPDLQIDLGALLQGYAADRLALVLEEFGSKEFLIEVGGELLARSSWHVAVENPGDSSKPIRTFVLKDAALTTSGTYRAKGKDGEARWSHIIDPKTGRPVDHATTLVSVVHPVCVDADALATTLLVLGPERGKEFAKTNKFKALFVSPKETTEHGFPSGD